MINGNCTRIEKFSKCYRDVNTFLIVGLIRPENKRRFGKKNHSVLRRKVSISPNFG